MAPPSGNVSRPGRTLAVLAALIIALLLAVVGGDITSPGNWHKNFKVLLGLDLTSGTTIELQAISPNGKPPSKSDMQQAISIMLNRVDGAGFTEATVEQQGSNTINVAVPGADAQHVQSLVSRTAELQFRQVLLAAPNLASAAAPPTAPTPAPSPSGSASPSAAPSSSGSPAASPSPTASGHAAGLPGSGGTTREMARGARALSAAAAASPSPSASAAASASPSASASASPAPTPAGGSGVTTWQQAQGDPTLVSAQVKTLFNKLNCASPQGWQNQIGYTHQQYNNHNIQIVSCGKVNGVWYKYALDKAQVWGAMISSASAAPDQTSTGWVVNLNFKSNGTSAFGKLTTAMFDKYQGSPTLVQNDFGVVLDGTVVSAPYVRQPIVNGQAQISGSFNQASATTLANQLSYGALPLSFKTLQSQSVSPQLGRDQLNAGLIAGMIGLALVVLYLIFYYRGLAVVSVFSLAIAALLSWLAVILLGKYQNFALSLAGIAGLIVAIGITADSFVVYFERLRDEVREGRSLRAAVERGWTRARRTILVSDTVSFLAAALLYWLAIGDVRGFAFTLGLTTIIDVVVVFTFTKPMMTLLARTKFYGGGHPLSGLDPVRLGARAPWRGSRRPAPARTTSAKEA